MDFSVVEDVYINGYAKEAWFNNVKVWSKGVDVDAIMNSLICWYDIKRQGCTNESMSADSKLKDLSGHNYDLTCSNFSWSGMSGIGGYLFNRPVERWSRPSVNNGVYELTNNTIHITTLNTNNTTYYCTNPNALSEQLIITIDDTGTVVTKPFKIRISGLPEDKQVRINGLLGSNVDGVANNVALPGQLFGNGEHTVQSVTAQNTYTITQINFPSINIDSDTADDVDITIELLPEYPNALVSDGVDDLIGTIPGFPKDEGTAIVIMQELEGNKSAALLMPADREGFSNIWYNGLFIGGNNLKGIGCYNDIGNRTMINYNEDEAYAKNTSIFTWNNSIPKVTLNLNNRESKEVSYEQLHTQYNFFRDNNSGIYAKAALYSVLLFDRTLTTAEIEWVRKNMIDGDYPAPIDVDPIAIKNSMVFWFDPKRQGCTNANMSENPTMVDLSGNNNNGNCQNFDWVQSNGIGRPDIDFTQWTTVHSTINDASQYKLVSTLDTSGGGALAESGNNTLYRDIDRFKVRVSGIIEGYPIQADKGNVNEPTVIMESDGTYDIPGKTGTGRIRFAVPQSSAAQYTANPITFEVVPDYDGAIVCNGGCITVNNVEAGTISDYTLIYKRKYVDLAGNQDLLTALIMNTTGNTNLGLFTVEYKNAGAHYPYVRSKGGINYTLTQTDADSEFNYLTNTTYNGIELTPGTNTNGSTFNIGALRDAVGTSNAAIYSVILFNRVLNDREIEWVKSNLIEGDYIYE